MAATWISVILSAGLYVSQGGKAVPAQVVGIFDKSKYSEPVGSQTVSNATASLTKLPAGNNHIAITNQTDLHTLIKNKFADN